MHVRSLQLDDAQACDKIVLSLPWHFGQEDGRRDCAYAVRNQNGLVAELSGPVVGFLTFQQQFDAAAEITCLAVHNFHRRNGIGHSLIEATHSLLAGQGVTVVCALTVSPNDSDGSRADGYGATRRFYQSCGYVLTKEFADLWPGNKAVLMTKHLR